MLTLLSLFWNIFILENPDACINGNQVDRVFQPFFTTAGQSGGTGIGTYSAKLLCEIQKGLIAMQTDPPNGTRLTVSLPTSRSA